MLLNPWVSDLQLLFLIFLLRWLGVMGRRKVLNTFNRFNDNDSSREVITRTCPEMTCRLRSSTLQSPGPRCFSLQSMLRAFLPHNDSSIPGHSNLFPAAIIKYICGFVLDPKLQPLLTDGITITRICVRWRHYKTRRSWDILFNDFLTRTNS